MIEHLKIETEKNKTIIHFDKIESMKKSDGVLTIRTNSGEIHTKTYDIDETFKNYEDYIVNKNYDIYEQILNELRYISTTICSLKN